MSDACETDACETVSQVDLKAKAAALEQALEAAKKEIKENAAKIEKNNELFKALKKENEELKKKVSGSSSTGLTYQTLMQDTSSDEEEVEVPVDGEEPIPQLELRKLVKSSIRVGKARATVKYEQAKLAEIQAEYDECEARLASTA